jgi:hypothetical protein
MTEDVDVQAEELCALASGIVGAVCRTVDTQRCVDFT